jgi:hypothetical protein
MKNIRTLLALWAYFLVANAAAFQVQTSRLTRPPSKFNNPLKAAPKEALPDIVIPNVFNFVNPEDLENDDPRIWVPQTDCLSFRPLCFCTSQGCK